MSILLVEDCPVTAYAMTKLLKHIGFYCGAVTNGMEAVEKFCSIPYSLVLMDIDLPGLDGIQSTRRIRAWENRNNLSATPIIAFTGYATYEDRQKYFAAGMNDLLAKPYGLCELEKVLQKWLTAPSYPKYSHNH